MADGVASLLRKLVQLYQYESEVLNLTASADGPLPTNGWPVDEKKGKSLFVKATGACNVKIQGKLSADDETWYTLNKKDADGVITWTLIANEGAWIGTDLPCRYIRLWITDTSVAANIITASEGGGR